MGQSDEVRQVYMLVDPRNGTPRYVGISKDPRSRLAQHMNEVENDKRAWLAELKRMGLSPELEVLETVVEREGDVDAVAEERERYWISSLLRSGAPLANIFGIPRSSSRPAQKRPQRDPETPFAKARIEAGLTIAQLSIEANLSAPTIKRMDRGYPVLAAYAARACIVLSRYLGRPLTYTSLGVKTVPSRRKT
jgi:predicted GIY-YIG superfamily endonuclease